MFAAMSTSAVPAAPVMRVKSPSEMSDARLTIPRMPAMTVMLASVVTPAFVV